MYSERSNKLVFIVVILIYSFFNRYLYIVSYSLCHGLSLPSDRALICNYSNIFSGKKIQTSKYNHLPYIYTNAKHVIMNHQKLNLCNLKYIVSVLPKSLTSL